MLLGSACFYSCSSDWAKSTKVQGIRALIDQDWDLYTETAANVWLGWSAGDEARRYAALMRDSVTQDFLRTVILLGINDFDVTRPRLYYTGATTGWVKTLHAALRLVYLTPSSSY